MSYCITGVDQLRGCLHATGTTFFPVRSCGSVFIYTTTIQDLVLVRVIPMRVHPSCCTGRIETLVPVLNCEVNSSQYHVNAV